jgi:hypothetical protein
MMRQRTLREAIKAGKAAREKAHAAGQERPAAETRSVQNVSKTHYEH